ncbi:MAG TPA: RDD family protein [Candidatus Limnocylindrales bacterium]|nr:RDD family protein [Candidatus Limnocylindrales bacterium]
MDDDRRSGEPDGSSRAGPILSAGVEAPPGVGTPPVDWAAPGADGSGGTGPATLRNGMLLAGVGTRLAAFLVDVFVLGCASVAISLVSNRIADDTASDVVATVLSAAIAIGYFAVAWISPRSATLGQRLGAIRVVDATSLGPLETGQAFVRSVALGAALNLLSIAAPIDRTIGALLLIWPFALLVTAIIDVRHQGLHDRWTRTLVVRPAETSVFPLTVGCFMIVLIVFAAPFIIAMAAGPSIQQWLDQIKTVTPR